MERHSIDEPAAFEMLREHARSTNRKLVDVASAVVDGHRLLPKRPIAGPDSHAGKEGVDGSRPSERFGFFPAWLAFLLSVLTAFMNVPRLVNGVSTMRYSSLTLEEEF
jgi:hypothetical protein